MLETVVISLGSALIMSMTQYVAKMKNGESFALAKLGRTMGAGVGAAIIAWLAGTEPSLSDPTAVGAVVATTGGLDVLSKLIWRLFSGGNK